MKKKIGILLAVVSLFISSMVYSSMTIPIDESNVLPDNNYYGNVTVTQKSSVCVQITADANQAVLSPLSNFGIQAFGFNYAGDPECLDIDLPSGWEDKTNSNLDGFGKFIEKTDTTGGYRVDPLVLTVCNACGNLTEGEVIIKNSKGYTFSMHIAGFEYDGVSYGDTSSAFFATQKTTLVILSKFEAIPGNHKILIKWQTESEIENAGFNVWRMSEDEKLEKTNCTPIPANGSATEGALYILHDTGLSNGKTYIYFLEDIDTNGFSTFHGPINATPKLIYFWQIIH